MNCRILFSLLVLSLLFQNTVYAVSVPDVVFTTKAAGKVVFNHGDHINKKGLTNDCRACHDALFDLKKKKHYTMSDMKIGRSCGACHDGKRAFPLENCGGCHHTKELVYQVKATGPTAFSHKAHLAKTPDCGTCHPSIFDNSSTKRFTMAEMKRGKSCGACHNGTKAPGLDSCVTCHPVKEITFKEESTGPIHFSHKSHVEVAGCDKCHPKLYALNRHNKPVGMAAMKKGKSCGACHNAKAAFPVKDCAKCHPVRELEFEVKNFSVAQFSHESHMGLYSCTGCHTSLYKIARNKGVVTMREMEEGKSCGHCHDGKTAFTVKDKCGTCHKI